MKRLIPPIRLALAGLLVLGLSHAGPAFAQEPPKDMVAFKATFTGRTPPPMVIPLSPPIVPVTLSFTGEAAPLGQVTYISHEIHRLGATGMPHAITDGIGAFTAASGDAIFITHTGLIRPTDTPGIFAFEEVWAAFGGKGKLLGATGGGIMRGTIDARELATKGADWTVAFEGLVSAPRP